MSNSIIRGSVMVGVDGSSSSDTAVIWAATYAQAQHRPLAIVHSDGGPAAIYPTVDRVGPQQALRTPGRQVTDHALGLARANSPALEVSAHNHFREPRELLLETAANASVLVLGSRGRGPVASLLLGSVSVALASQSPCPVVVARPEPTSAGPTELPIVVGSDGTEASAGAIAFGFELASWQSRRLEIVHALGADDWILRYPAAVSPDIVHEAIENQKLLLAESLSGYAAKFPDVDATSRVMRGSPTDALVEASQHASVIVVGSRKESTAAKRLLGSVSRSVVERAHCSVAAVH